MLNFFNDAVISVITPIMLLAVGAFFSFKLNFFYIRHPVIIIKSMLKRKNSGGISPFRAVTLALAGTLGVGNIAGVASSIAIGGFGSVFWMILCAVVAMVLKYAEIVLAVLHRRRTEDGWRGGAPYYILDLFRSRGHSLAAKALASLFAILCIINAVTMGCMIQSNAVSTSFRGVLGAPTWVTGALLALVSLFVITGNARWISGFSEKTVPVMTVGYLVLCVAVLAARHELIGEACALIFKDAFHPVSAVGGAVGFLFSKGLKSGVMRGLMSNEAGCGTAPTAHAAADCESPAAQGFWGIFEVFVDTVLLCSLTAIVIIIAVIDTGGAAMEFAGDPMMMAINAFSVILGDWAEYFMSIAVLLFALATVICWAHYGKESLTFLTRKRAPGAIYVAAYTLFIFIGAVCTPNVAWLAADLALGIMTIINLATLLPQANEVKAETERFFGKKSVKLR